MEKHFLFRPNLTPPFYFIFFSFEAFPHLGKDSAQNFLQAISQSVVEVFKCWFYNYKYQNVFWSTLLYPLLYDLVLKLMFIVLNNKYLEQICKLR